MPHGSLVPSVLHCRTTESAIDTVQHTSDDPYCRRYSSNRSAAARRQAMSVATVPPLPLGPKASHPKATTPARAAKTTTTNQSKTPRALVGLLHCVVAIRSKTSRRGHASQACLCRRHLINQRPIHLPVTVQWKESGRRIAKSDSSRLSDDSLSLASDTCAKPVPARRSSVLGRLSRRLRTGTKRMVERSRDSIDLIPWEWYLDATEMVDI